MEIPIIMIRKRDYAEKMRWMNIILTLMGWFRGEEGRITVWAEGVALEEIDGR
jgi:hypothetical protein